MVYKSPTQITYVIPMEVVLQEPSGSIFCGFSREFIEKAYFLSIISTLPQYIEELSQPSFKNIAMRRDIGDYRIALLNTDILDRIPNDYTTPFVCVFSTRNTHKASLNFIKKLKHKAIHVSEMKSDGSLLPHQITHKKMKREFVNIVDSYFRSKGENTSPNSMRLFSGRPKTYLPNKFRLKERIQNIVRPMERALQCHRYRFNGAEHLGSGGLESYATGIQDIVSDINRIRASIPMRLGEAKNDLILSLPSFYAYLYKDRQLLDAIFKNAGKFVKGFFEKHILKYRGYVATNGGFNPEVHHSLSGHGRQLVIH